MMSLMVTGFFFVIIVFTLQDLIIEASSLTTQQTLLLLGDSTEIVEVTVSEMKSLAKAEYSRKAYRSQCHSEVQNRK